MFRLIAVVILTLTGCFTPESRNLHAAAVESFTSAEGIDASAPFADPDRALGPPDGRTVAIGVGSSLVVRFFREIPDGPGDDLRVYEVGEDGAAARIAVSGDGLDFIEYERTAQGAVTLFDFSATALESVSFVRIRGIDDRGEEPGFDLDAVEALQ